MWWQFRNIGWTIYLMLQNQHPPRMTLPHIYIWYTIQQHTRHVHFLVNACCCSLVLFLLRTLLCLYGGYRTVKGFYDVVCHHHHHHLPPSDCKWLVKWWTSANELKSKTTTYFEQNNWQGVVFVWPQHLIVITENVFLFTWNVAELLYIGYTEFRFSFDG